MVFIPFGASAYENNDFGLPPVKLENWFAEEAPDRPDKPFRLIPTPGVVAFEDAPTPGVARGTFQADGVLGDDVISVVADKVVRTTSGAVATAITGTVVNDSLPVSFAVSQTPELVVAAGGTAYRVNTSSLTSITIASATGPIIGVAQLNQRHLFLEEGSGRLHISDVADCTTVTEFITAERNPDRLLAAVVSGDTVYLAGEKSIELWFGTGDAATPLLARPGGIIPKGVIGRFALVAADFGVFGVADDAVLYRLDGYDRTPLSPPFISRMIESLSAANAAKVQLGAYEQAGHSFLHLMIPGNGDFFLDLKTGTWHRRRPPIAGEFGFGFWSDGHRKIYGQKLDTGALVTLDISVSTTLDEAVTRKASALVPIESRARIANLIIDANEGVGLDGSGFGSDPVLELRVMRDGRTLDNPYQRAMGKHGDFGWRTIFGPLGQARGPVTGFEIAMSHPVAYSVYGATANLARP